MAMKMVDIAFKDTKIIERARRSFTIIFTRVIRSSFRRINSRAPLTAYASKRYDRMQLQARIVLIVMSGNSPASCNDKIRRTTLTSALSSWFLAERIEAPNPTNEMTEYINQAGPNESFVPISRSAIQNTETATRRVAVATHSGITSLTRLGPPSTTISFSLNADSTYGSPRSTPRIRTTIAR
jgi:hypothetical protein